MQVRLYIRVRLATGKRVYADPAYDTNGRIKPFYAVIDVETPILPGKAAKGDFTLRGLAPQFDTSPLYPAGDYKFHFRFQSQSCFASPDGSFCIQSPKEQVAAFSNVVEIHATAFIASGSSR